MRASAVAAYDRPSSGGSDRQSRQCSGASSRNAASARSQTGHRHPGCSRHAVSYPHHASLAQITRCLGSCGSESTRDVDLGPCGAREGQQRRTDVLRAVVVSCVESGRPRLWCARDDGHEHCNCDTQHGMSRAGLRRQSGDVAHQSLILTWFYGMLGTWGKSSGWGVVLSSSFVTFFGSIPGGTILPSRPRTMATVARNV